MFEIYSETGKHVLVAKLIGLVRAGDFFEGMPILEKLVAETRPRGLLCDWTELTGWDEEGESIRFAARLAMQDKLERVAVLADRVWDAEVGRFEEAIHLPVRRFSPSDRQSALDWLESDTQ